jgi:acyl dehydratase
MFDTSKIGYSFPPFTAIMESNKLRELALAIGDDNPIYQSQQAAQAAGYQDIPLLPTTGTIFLFWQNTHFVEQLAELGLDIARLLHREETYEYLAPLHPGETLTGIMAVLDGSTRKGSHETSIDLVTLQLRYTNHQRQPVLIATTRLVSLEK